MKISIITLNERELKHKDFRYFKKDVIKYYNKRIKCDNKKTFYGYQKIYKTEVTEWRLNSNNVRLYYIRKMSCA